MPRTVAKTGEQARLQGNVNSHGHTHAIIAGTALDAPIVKKGFMLRKSLVRRRVCSIFSPSSAYLALLHSEI